MEFLKLLEENDISFKIKRNRLIVYDHVDLSHKQLKEFPACPMTFCGNLDLSHTQIEELPDNITINGYLDISHTPIKELPKCTVNGYLNIDGTSITKIPKDLRIKWCIYTPINSKLDIYIEKSGKIRIGVEEHSIEEWEKFFKERRSFNIPYVELTPKTPKDYDLVEQDFKTAVKLLESWNS